MKFLLSIYSTLAFLIQKPQIISLIVTLAGILPDWKSWFTTIYFTDRNRLLSCIYTLMFKEYPHPRRIQYPHPVAFCLHFESTASDTFTDDTTTLSELFPAA